MKSLLRVLFTVVFIFALTHHSVWAQGTAQISGAVRDQSGAVLPGVEVTATQTQTGAARTVVTNETGSYVLPSLAVGPYRLEALLPGFRGYVQNGIVLQVNTSPVINVVLEVGGVTESVEVQANAALVETRSQGVGQVVENQRILELPLNGRNVTDLIILAGAATPSPGGTLGDNAVNPFNLGKTKVSIAGGLGFGVDFNLDGSNYNNTANGLDLPMPFPDALQEFKVETSALSAQSGYHSAGAVTAVTKSGTNAIHGALFEFVRNYKFNARNTFAAKRDSLKRNQYGGTIGGPVLRNKLFFFAGYQGTKLRQDPAATTSFIPTAAMLNGDFTQIASAACNAGRSINLGGPFVNNRIDPSLLSPAALKAISHPDFPKTSDPCGKVLWGGRLVQNEDQVLGRLDYQSSARHSIFGRYMATSLRKPSPYQKGQNLLATYLGLRTDGLVQAFTLGSTYLYGNNIVNAFRFTANRSAATSLGNDFFSTTDLGIKTFTYNTDPRSTVIAVTGAFNIGDFGSSTSHTRSATFGFNDDLSLAAGNHQIAFGGNVSQDNYNFSIATWSGGYNQFTGAITGLSIADFLIGRPNTSRQGTTENQLSRQRHVGLYTQDSWKVTPRVTMNLGVRWEPFIPSQRIDKRMHQFNLDAWRQGIRTTQYRNAPPGFFYPGDPQFTGGLAAMNTNWINFSPRVGLAWDMNGDGRTSVRAAYGLFHDFYPMQYYVSLASASPWDPTVTLVQPNFDDPWATYPGGNPFPFTIGPDVFYGQFSSYLIVKPKTKNPGVSQWNLSVQQQIGRDWRVSGSYIGSQTAHIWSIHNINPAVYIPGASTTANTNQRRLLTLEKPTQTALGAIHESDDGGTASYHGMLLSVERHAAKGITVSSNYTWSHCISDPFSGVLVLQGVPYNNPNNRSFDRGNCVDSAADRRHVFNLSAVVQTPQFSNEALRAIASGWSLSPIFRIQSGGYFSVTTSQDRALNGQLGQRLYQLMPDVYSDTSTTNYLNPAAFALAPLGSLSNMSRASLLGPGSRQFDLALSRRFVLSEGKTLEARGEAFNITNSVNRDNPVTDFGASNFGRIVTARDPRIMQFALKFVF